MTVHLVKLCVGAANVDDLARWQAGRMATRRAAGAMPLLCHQTFQTPKRRDDLLAGGSLYWVIKGVILVRQRIIDLAEGTKDDGRPCCLIGLDPELVPVRPTPRRAFQGWRYLDADDVPPDLAPGQSAGDLAEMPPKMRRALAELGLL
jgi:hypothetical protein